MRGFLDGEGRLSCLQLVRVRRAASVLARIDAAIDEELAGDLGGSHDGPDSPWLVAVHTAARSNWEWGRLEQGGLVVALPASEREAAELARALLASAGEQSASLEAPLTRIRVTDGRTTLVFAAEEGELLRFVDRDTGRHCDERLLEALIERGWELPQLSRAGVDATLRLPEPAESR